MLLTACAPPGQRAIDVPVHGQGIAPAPFAAGAWTVTLDRAEVAFGPFWLCASEGADVELCPTALVELREPVTIDALDPSMQMLATARGLTGTVRSAMYDLGIVWLATEPGSRALPGAPEAHTAVFRGTATDGARTIRFAVDLDVEPAGAGQTIVVGQRTMRELSGADVLVVRVDPTAWFRRVDFDELATHPGDPIPIERGDPAYESLIIAITAGERPALEWP
jgi:hypothetical protein